MSTDVEAPRAVAGGTYSHLLGTNIHLRVCAIAGTRESAESLARRAEAAVIDEIAHLQRVFSIFDTTSELSRWRRGEIDEISAALTEVLAAASQWCVRSGGAFHPAAGALRARWSRAAEEGREPEDTELDDLSAALATLPYDVRDVANSPHIVRTGDCSSVDLNAIAKGYIVDRAVELAAGLPGVVDVLVNAGGDLRHTGERPVRVGVEDPDNIGGPPLDVIELAEGAVATSSAVHRGFRVGDRWYSQVIDPRTGRPVVGHPSTTVRAPDTMTADAISTVAGVLDWPAALDVVAQVPDVAVLAIDGDNALHRSPGW